LFGLGALTYFVLTGRHAYPARRLLELPAAWQRPPQPPSQHVAEIPPALDALVLSLLALDPMARPSSAAVVIEMVLPELPIRRRVAWLSVRAFYADALNRAGEHARARGVLLEALSTMLPDEDQVVSRFLEPQRQLALAEAGLGNHSQATQLLNDLLKRWGEQDQPLLVGLLHKACAEVALLMSDADAFEEHLAEMGRRFTNTRNPALVAQWERLGEQGVRSGVRRATVPARLEAEFATGNAHDMLASRRLSELSSAPNACEAALALVIDRSSAKTGYLYVLEGDKMSLRAASVPHEPPKGLETELLQAALRAELDMEDRSETEAVRTESGIAEHHTTAFLESHPPPPPARSHFCFLLISIRHSLTSVVGGVILEAGPGFVPPDFDFLEPIAGILAERRTRTTGT
jgi:hypothetical protein